MDTAKCYDRSNYKPLQSNNCNCRMNTNEYYRIYRLKNKDKIALKNKKYREANPNYNKEYYHKNKENRIEKMKECNKKYWSENKVKIAENRKKEIS